MSSVKSHNLNSKECCAIAVVDDGICTVQVYCFKSFKLWLNKLYNILFKSLKVVREALVKVFVTLDV